MIGVQSGFISTRPHERHASNSRICSRGSLVLDHDFTQGLATHVHVLELDSRGLVTRLIKWAHELARSLGLPLYGAQPIMGTKFKQGGGSFFKIFGFERGSLGVLKVALCWRSATESSSGIARRRALLMLRARPCVLATSHYVLSLADIK